MSKSSKSSSRSSVRSSTGSVVSRTVRATVPVEVRDLVKTRILSMLSKRSEWNGTMTELNDMIRSGRSTEWPGSASVLRRVVNTVVHSIRKAGYRVEFSRTPDRERRRVVSFSKRVSK